MEKIFCANFHQLTLGSHLGLSSQSLQQSTQGITSRLLQFGFSGAAVIEAIHSNIDQGTGTGGPQFLSDI
jgi:hypothetical protein